MTIREIREILGGVDAPMDVNGPRAVRIRSRVEAMVRNGEPDFERRLDRDDIAEAFRGRAQQLEQMRQQAVAQHESDLRRRRPGQNTKALDKAITRQLLAEDEAEQSRRRRAAEATIRKSWGWPRTGIPDDRVAPPDWTPDVKS